MKKLMIALFVALSVTATGVSFTACGEKTEPTEQTTTEEKAASTEQTTPAADAGTTGE
jgi:hypothetical protein